MVSSDKLKKPKASVATPTPKIELLDTHKQTETPSIFKRKKNPEIKENTSSVLEKKAEKFSEEALWKTWKKFETEQTNMGDTERLILNRKVRKGEKNTVIIYLASQLEVRFLENLEMDIIQYLRSNLNNDHIVLKWEIIKDDQNNTKKLYTSKDIFEHMVKENPHLLDLKDRLGLDFDY